MTNTNEHGHRGTTSDLWYTPPEILYDIRKSTAGRSWWDLTTDYPTPGMVFWYGDALGETPERIDALFCNPPYSRDSGGAGLFVRTLAEKYPNVPTVFLVNYDAWVPRLALELKMDVALFSERIKFVSGHSTNKSSSPRHANALLYRNWSCPELLGGIEMWRSK